MSTAPETGGRLAAYVKATPADAAFVASCQAEADALVAAHVGSDQGRVPAEILDRAALEVAADLFYRRKSQNGIATFGGGDVDLTPLRIARDPMHAARELLRPYLGGPFA